jgi:hypothetical protein
MHYFHVGTPLDCETKIEETKGMSRGKINLLYVLATDAQRQLGVRSRHSGQAAIQALGTKKGRPLLLGPLRRKITVFIVGCE